jgi:hypothetical protein
MQESINKPKKVEKIEPEVLSGFKIVIIDIKEDKAT